MAANCHGALMEYPGWAPAVRKLGPRHFQWGRPHCRRVMPELQRDVRWASHWTPPLPQAWRSLTRLLSLTRDSRIADATKAANNRRRTIWSHP